MAILEDGKIYIKLDPRGERNSNDKCWDDGIGGQIKQILLCHDAYFISGFQTIYERSGISQISKRHGGTKGNFETVCDFIHNFFISDAAFIGYQIPAMPRFPRSARGRRSPPKKIENSQMHPFDLLATVAGELLAKKESACSLYQTAEIARPVSTIKQRQLDNGSPSKSDVFDQGSCDEGSFVARFVCHAERGGASAVALVKSDASEKDGFAGDSAQSVLKFQLQKLKKTGTLTDDAMWIHNLEDPIDLDTKAPAVVSSDSSVEIPPLGKYHSAHSSSLHSVRDGMELIVDRDDDENSSGRTHNSAIYSKGFKPHCTGEHRVRKMSTPNYRKSDREAMNDGELWSWDEEIKPAFRTRKLCYTRQRTQRSSFKRKKSFERFSFSASTGGLCSQSVPDLLVKDDTKLDSSDPHADLNDAELNCLNPSVGSDLLSETSFIFPLQHMVGHAPRQGKDYHMSQLTKLIVISNLRASEEEEEEQQLESWQNSNEWVGEEDDEQFQGMHDSIWDSWEEWMGWEGAAI